jgi:hypothetical protein
MRAASLTRTRKKRIQLDERKTGIYSKPLSKL